MVLWHVIFNLSYLPTGQQVPSSVPDLLPRWLCGRYWRSFSGKMCDVTEVLSRVMSLTFRHGWRHWRCSWVHCVSSLHVYYVWCHWRLLIGTMCDLTDVLLLVQCVTSHGFLMVQCVPSNRFTMWDVTDVILWVLCMTLLTIFHGHNMWRCTVFSRVLCVTFLTFSLSIRPPISSFFF